MKLELNHKKKSGSNPNTWKLKTTLLKNVCINQKIKELKQFMETTGHFSPEPMGDGKGGPKGEIHSSLNSLKKIEKSRIQQLLKSCLYLKELENQQQIKPAPHTRREIIKIRAEINDIETRDTVECINKNRSWFFFKEPIISINHWPK